MGMVPLVCALCNITKRSHEKATRTKKLTGVSASASRVGAYLRKVAQ